MRYVTAILTALLVFIASPAHAAGTAVANCTKDGYRSDVQVTYTNSSVRRNITAVKVRTYDPSPVTVSIEGIAPNIYVAKSTTRGVWRVYYPNNYYDADGKMTAKFSNAGDYCGYRYL